MKYKAKRDLPKFARENHTLSPTKLKAIILSERNKNVTPESITLWFKRHPDTHAQLKSEILAEELPDIEVNENIFSNGNFKELASVKNWTLELDNRELAKKYVNVKYGSLRNACLGRAGGFDLVKEGKMSLKHPDRYTLKDAMNFLSIMKKRGFDTNTFKRDLRDFLQSKGIAIGKKFTTGKPKGYGNYAELFVDKETILKMLAWIKQRSFEAFVLDCFMFKTGTRISASLNAKIEHLNIVGEVAIQKVFDKGRKSKYPDGKEWKKRIDTQLLYDMKQLIGEKRFGNIFTITSNEIGKLNRAALNRFTPDTLKQYPNLMINHFWRHMMFQHTLRLCEWNYTIAAALGGSTAQSCEESYGKPPEQTIKEWKGKYHIEI